MTNSPEEKSTPYQMNQMKALTRQSHSDENLGDKLGMDKFDSKKTTSPE